MKDKNKSFKTWIPPSKSLDIALAHSKPTNKERNWCNLSTPFVIISIISLHQKKKNISNFHIFHYVSKIRSLFRSDELKTEGARRLVFLHPHGFFMWAVKFDITNLMVESVSPHFLTIADVHLWMGLCVSIYICM